MRRAKSDPFRGGDEQRHARRRESVPAPPRCRHRAYSPASRARHSSAGRASPHARHRCRRSGDSRRREHNLGRRPDGPGEVLGLVHGVTEGCAWCDAGSRRCRRGNRSACRRGRTIRWVRSGLLSFGRRGRPMMSTRSSNCRRNFSPMRQSIRFAPAGADGRMINSDGSRPAISSTSLRRIASVELVGRSAPRP